MSENSNFCINDGRRMLFIGDSITDSGRRDASFPLGSGFVRLFVDLVRSRYPERAIEFYNKGIGGNTILDLQNRWTEDVIEHKPDWLCVLVGINDLHSNFNQDQDVVVTGEKFQQAYHDCLTRTKAKTDAKIVLMDPFYMSIESDPHSDRKRALDLLPEYIEVVHEIAEEFNTLHVLTHEIFQEQLKYYPYDIFCDEPIHPRTSGCMVIAHALLAALNG